MPRSWSAGAAPSTLYLDGVSVAAASLKLLYEHPVGGGVLQCTADQVAVLVTEPVSHSPKSDYAIVWCSLPHLGYADGEAFLTELESQQFQPIWYSDLDDYANTSFGSCTLQAYKSYMHSAGAFTIISHGDPGCHLAVYSTDDAAGLAACQQWIGSEQNMQVESIYANGRYMSTVRVSSTWHASNWATAMNANETIAMWSICFSARPNTSTGESAVKEAAGGRWRSGYYDPTSESEATRVNTQLLGRMDGKLENASRRTAGEAWDSGIDFSVWSSVVMDGNPWTTLCPGPQKQNAVLPTGTAQRGKGSGCILFDTYVDALNADPSDALIRQSGRSTSYHMWVENGFGSFGLRFDFASGTGETSMRCVADKCRNVRFDALYNGRPLDGDRVSPNQDNKDWSF